MLVSGRDAFEGVTEDVDSGDLDEVRPLRING